MWVLYARTVPIPRSFLLATLPFHFFPFPLRHFALKTSRHRELFDRVFAHVITSDAVKEAKPNPEIFNTALAKFDGMSAGDALVFEDAPLGVQAALNAGMSVVMVNARREPPEGLEPTQFVRSVYDFLPEQWGLPMFDQECKE